MSSYFYDRLTEPKDSSSKILPRESEKDSFNWAQVALGSDLYLAMSYLIPSNVPTFFQLCSCSPIKNIFLKKTNFQFFLLLLQISQENCFGVQFPGLKIVCIYALDFYQFYNFVHTCFPIYGCCIWAATRTRKEHRQLPIMFFSIHKICYFDVCCPDMCIL